MATPTKEDLIKFIQEREFSSESIQKIMDMSIQKAQNNEILKDFAYTIDSINLTYNYEIELTQELDALAENHNFTLLDIYKMTLWKLNRFPYVDDKIMLKYNHLASYKEELTPEAEKEAREILTILLKTKGVRLPMASTYLRFRNPNLFQIIDQRVWRVVQEYRREMNLVYKNSDNVQEEIDKYFNYLKDLRNLAKEKNIVFKNADRAFYEWDIQKGNKLKYYVSNFIHRGRRKSN